MTTFRDLSLGDTVHFKGGRIIVAGMRRTPLWKRPRANHTGKVVRLAADHVTVREWQAEREWWVDASNFSWAQTRCSPEVATDGRK